MEAYGKSVSEAAYAQACVNRAEPDYPSNSFVVANETLDRVHSLARRVISLADRLIGPVPTAGAASNDAPVNGLFDVIRGACLQANNSIFDANDALDRIERALP